MTGEGERAYTDLIAMLKVTFWIFVLVLALSFFGISIVAIINSPAGQENFGYLAFLIVSGWQWVATHAQLVLQRVGL